MARIRARNSAESQNETDLSGVMLGAADRAASARWVPALRAAAATEGSLEERLYEIERRYTRSLVGAGAAVGLGSAVPGAGVATFLGLSAAELAWTTTKSAELIMAVGAAHGLDDASLEERKNWILAVMVSGDGAAGQFAQLAGNAAGGGFGKGISGRWFNRANRYLTRRFVTRYASSRLANAAGKALPFGIGAAVGGAANYAVARTVVRQARLLFAEIQLTELAPPPPPALPPPPTMPPPPTTRPPTN